MIPFRRTPLTVLFTLLVLFASAAPLAADEGMWTFDNPPAKLLKERYGFDVTKEWLDALRLASVRFSDGGSGAFVSKSGLVLTNHHVALDCIQKISTPGKNYVRNGFLAKGREAEVPCPDLELNLLTSFEDVTTRVTGAVPKAATDREARDLRRAATAAIEKECQKKTGLKCEVVPFYEGSEYRLHRYVRYADVRLAFAPEQEIAFFGGDPDNFTYPRYDLDFALFRVYEKGRPVVPARFLPRSKEGVKEGDLVFVSGHPGATRRQRTLAWFDLHRNVTLPLVLKMTGREQALLARYSARGPEEARRAADLLFGVENSLKAWRGYADGLRDPSVLAKKAEEEAVLKATVKSDPALATVGDPWAEDAAAVAKMRGKVAAAQLVSFDGSNLLEIAGTIVQLVAEKKKPNAKRLDEYRESALPSLQLLLYSTAPVYRDLEEVRLADRWAEASETLGSGDPFVTAALDGKSPAEAARLAVSGTRLSDPEFRKALVKGGTKAVAASDDPMIAAARRLDPHVRALREFLETEVDEPQKRAGERIGKARFAAFGKTRPPDATFTLRLSVGTVKGFEAEGTRVPYKTTFWGLYERSAAFDGAEPFRLPPRWTERRGALDLGTPLNFVSTNDLIGGNSGSPVVNRNGEIVGLVFDGNIESLGWRYAFDDTKGRAVSVDVRAIREALRRVYDAPALAAELAGE